MGDNGVGGAGANKPIDLGAFQGARETEQKEQQLGSDGRLKGTKVSKVKNTRKYIQHGGAKGREAYHAKRDRQVALSERRVQVLNTLESPAKVASSLDTASFKVSGHSFNFDRKEDPLLAALKTVHDETQLTEDDKVTTNGRTFTAMTVKGSKSRAQKDNTTFLQQTLADTKTPHGLVLFNESLKEAEGQGYISGKQAKSLHKELDKQLRSQVDHLRLDLRTTPTESGEDLRQVQLARLDNIHEISLALNEVNRDLLNEKLPGGTVVRKELRDLALDTYQKSTAALEPVTGNLTETKARLEHSQSVLQESLKSVLQETCSSTRVNKYLGQAETASHRAHEALFDATQVVKKAHQQVNDLTYKSIPHHRAKTARLEAELLALKEKAGNSRKPQKYDKKISGKEAEVTEAKEQAGRFHSFRTSKIKKMEEIKKQHVDGEQFHSASGAGPQLTMPPRFLLTNTYHLPKRPGLLPMKQWLPVNCWKEFPGIPIPKRKPVIRPLSTLQIT